MVQVLVMKRVTSVHQNLLHNYTCVCAYKTTVSVIHSQPIKLFFRKVICVLDVIQEMAHLSRMSWQVSRMKEKATKLRSSLYKQIPMVISYFQNKFKVCYTK